MALVGPKLKKELEAAILAGLLREFGPEAAADPSSHKKHAAAISDIAMIIVKALQTEAQVLPGIPTAGSPVSQLSVAPGKIF